MREYWNSLNTRDRIAVSIGGVIGAAYLFYLFVYSPLTSAVSNGTKQLQEKKESLAWMQSVQKDKPLNKTKQTIAPDKLLSYFANALKESPFTQFAYQLQQANNADIQLSFEAVPFNLFMTWLKTRCEKYAIRIQSLNSSKTDTLGIVKLSITLSTQS